MISWGFFSLENSLGVANEVQFWSTCKPDDIFYDTMTAKGGSRENVEKDYSPVDVRASRNAVISARVYMVKKVKSREKRCTHTREAKATLDLPFSV
jgi:hypothetical protein